MDKKQLIRYNYPMDSRMILAQVLGNFKEKVGVIKHCNSSQLADILHDIQGLPLTYEDVSKTKVADLVLEALKTNKVSVEFLYSLVNQVVVNQTTFQVGSPIPSKVLIKKVFEQNSVKKDHKFLKFFLKKLQYCFYSEPFVSFIESEFREIATAIKFYKNGQDWYLKNLEEINLSSIDQIERAFFMTNRMELLKSPTFKEKYLKITHEKLNKMPNAQVVEYYTSRRLKLYSFFDEEETQELYHRGEFLQEIKAYLDTRPHVLSKQQSKLIRKMSIHAGKKLSLREAQLLNNQLQRKK